MLPPRALVGVVGLALGCLTREAGSISSSSRSIARAWLPFHADTDVQVPESIPR